jgi:hypothetical protein
VRGHSPASEPNGNVAPRPSSQDKRRDQQPRSRGERSGPIPALFSRRPYGAGQDQLALAVRPPIFG